MPDAADSLTRAIATARSQVNLRGGGDGEERSTIDRLGEGRGLHSDPLVGGLHGIGQRSDRSPAPCSMGPRPAAGYSSHFMKGQGLPEDVLEVFRQSYLNKHTFMADCPDYEFLDDGDSVVM